MKITRLDTVLNYKIFKWPREDGNCAVINYTDGRKKYFKRIEEFERELEIEKESDFWRML